MGKRLTKIVTRTGDNGTTGLGDGSRVGKASARIDALGDLDELNSCIGALLAENLPDDVRAHLLVIQHDLFDLGGEVCIPGHAVLTKQKLARLDAWIEEFNAALPALKEFILPGGSRAGALCNVARAVCRRAERSVVRLQSAEPVSRLALQYLNRLSDLLVILSRAINHASGTPETYWRSQRLAAAKAKRHE
jgi:cob(I)alamin adenosyltransferase